MVLAGRLQNRLSRLVGGVVRLRCPDSAKSLRSLGHRVSDAPISTTIEGAKETGQSKVSRLSCKALER
eukprot:COSAG05_NODE_459_length_9617_cov_12.484661_6_plen_68_part_00